MLDISLINIRKSKIYYKCVSKSKSHSPQIQKKWQKYQKELNLSEQSWKILNLNYSEWSSGTNRNLKKMQVKSKLVTRAYKYFYNHSICLRRLPKTFGKGLKTLGRVYTLLTISPNKLELSNKIQHLQEVTKVLKMS